MTRADVLANVKDTLTLVGLDTIKKEVGKVFYDMDDVVEALYYALTSGLNIVLYGPGGFGKSEVVKEFLRVVGIHSSTIIGFEDMEVDGLLGVVDIKKLTEESIYEIKFENSVFRNPGVLILEEFLDARPSTAAALKDILSEGGYRRGDSFVESLISSVIICTNTSPDDMATSNSTSAFYKERFPIVINVTWKSFDYDTYISYLHHIHPDRIPEEEVYFQVLAELCARTSAGGNIVSPRIAKHALNLVLSTKSFDGLNYLAGINTAELEEARSACTAKEERRRIRTLSVNLRNKFSLIESVETYSILALNDALADLSYVKLKLSKLVLHDPESYAIVGELLAKTATLYDELSKKITVSISADRQASLDLLFALQ